MKRCSAVVVDVGDVVGVLVPDRAGRSPRTVFVANDRDAVPARPGVIV